jgi:hypothetical protein
VKEKTVKWGTFAAYAANPYNYKSKYKTQLQKLDALGAVNLSRVTRKQFPSIPINYLAAVFFCPVC